MALITLVAAGCGSDDPMESLSEVPDGRNGALGFVGTEIQSVPNQWAASPGWEITGAQIIGDQNSDGYVDAAAGVSDGSSHRTAVVYGPLRRSVTLPDDADAVILNASVSHVGDFTGDGVPDLDLAMMLPPLGEPAYAILEGPFAGEIDAWDLPKRRLIEDITDVDGDGVMDAISYDATGRRGERVDVFYGPASRWTENAVADLIIQPGCEGDDSWWGYGDARTYPDIDGDGRQELRLVGYSEPSCHAYFLNVPDPGTYLLSEDPTVRNNIKHVVPLADQNADGYTDVYSEDVGEVLLGPIRILEDGSAASDLPGWAIGVPGMLPVQQPFDANGDGVRDFLGFTSEPADLSATTVQEEFVLATGKTVVLVLGGEEGLAQTSYAEGWSLPNDGNVINGAVGFVEDEVAVMLVRWQGGLAIVDIADSATSLP